jgi:hypothetical protein
MSRGSIAALIGISWNSSGNSSARSSGVDVEAIASASRISTWPRARSAVASQCWNSFWA